MPRICELANNYTVCCTFRELKEMGREFWHEKMEEHYEDVDLIHPLRSKQKQSWFETYDILMQVINLLPDAFLDLSVVFEFVLKYCNRPDCLVIGKTQSQYLNSKVVNTTIMIIMPQRARLMHIINRSDISVMG